MTPCGACETAETGKELGSDYNLRRKLSASSPAATTLPVIYADFDAILESTLQHVYLVAMVHCRWTYV